MTSRPARIALIAAAALVLAAGGGLLGAGLYAALVPEKTTTVVEPTSTDSPARVSRPTDLSVAEVYREAHRGVVDIEAGTAGNRGSAAGSGFVIDTDGHVVTNQHVVADEQSVRVTLWNGESYGGEVVGTDPATDLAVVRIDAPSSQLHPLPLGDSDGVRVGDGTVAIGSPFGLSGTVTSGIVSALNRQISTPPPDTTFSIGGTIQTDAAINHGNSGGPLLDMRGRVIGVNTQIRSDSGGNDGIGFAVPSNTVREVTAQLVAGKTVKHPYLGVSLESSSEPRGVRVQRIVPDGPADAAGLRAGDVITRIAGTPIRSFNDLSNTIDEHEPGDTVAVTYSRGGKTATAKVTLGTRPS